MLGDRYKYIKHFKKPELINVDGTDIQLLPWIAESNREESLEVYEENNIEEDVIALINKHRWQITTNVHNNWITLTKTRLYYD